MPTLTATPADGKVILTWDNISDTKTRDPFLGNVNDFEGYKLFRATDKYFSDAEVITDGYGTPTFMKPIFMKPICFGPIRVQLNSAKPQCPTAPLTMTIASITAPRHYLRVLCQFNQMT